MNCESSSRVCVEFQEFVTDVTPLFLAVHAGNAELVRKLLVITSSLLGSTAIRASFSTVLLAFCCCCCCCSVQKHFAVCFEKLRIRLIDFELFFC